MRAPRAENEDSRLRALHELQMLDTAPEERFDHITRLAARVFDVPFAVLTLVDRERQWFKSSYGFAAAETSRDQSFCAHAILRDESFVVPDALEDDRFADNPAVTGDPHVRFYAGHPIAAPDGSNVGTLCVFDQRPRELSEPQLQTLRDLAALAQRELCRRDRRRRDS
jgi:GAF domain-containing protein